MSGPPSSPMCRVPLNYTQTLSASKIRRPAQPWRSIFFFLLMPAMQFLKRTVCFPGSGESWRLTACFAGAYQNCVSSELYVKYQAVTLTYDPLSWKCVCLCLPLLTDETVILCFYHWGSRFDLVRELTSHKLHGAAKKKKKIQRTNEQEDVTQDLSEETGDGRWRSSKARRMEVDVQIQKETGKGLKACL